PPGSAPAVGRASPRLPAPRGRLRLGRRLAARPHLTAGSLPIAATGMKVLVGDGGAAIESDVAYVALALVTLAASGFLITLLCLLLFVLLDRDRTERLVKIIKVTVPRRHHRDG